MKDFEDHAIISDAKAIVVGGGKTFGEFEWV